MQFYIFVKFVIYNKCQRFICAFRKKELFSRNIFYIWNGKGGVNVVDLKEHCYSRKSLTGGI